MAALKARQSHETPLPASQESRPKCSTKKRKLKGKGKETMSYTAIEQQQSVDWEWAILADPSASRTPPVFTKDGSYFFSLVGSSIKIYSVTTGQIVSTLSAPRSTKTATEHSLLTSAILSPWNAFQLITGSLDGRLMVWDFLDATLLHTIDVVRPIIHICAHEKLKNTVFVAASTPNTKKNNDGIVLQVSLNSDADKNSATRKSPAITSVGKIRFPTGLAFSPSGTYLVATAGHKVYIATISSLKSGFVKYVSPDHLTCLAFHPFEDYFATGDQKGVIRLWYCLNESLAFNVKGIEKRTQTASFHWHAHAVSSIAFTSNGAYLLSGGEEAVLVIWQIPSGKKEFVPRLGAPINAVSVSKGPSEESYLVGLADATYSFINPGSLRVSRSCSVIKLDPASHGQLASKIPPPFTVHAISSTLILPSSHPSALQIYSPHSSKLLYELEVTPSYRVSRRDEKPIVPPRVEKIVVSPLGQWMATIDTREEDEIFHGEIYLKLWYWDPKNAIWILNTRIDRPHGSKRLTALSFSPSTSYLVTAGEDGIVKTWGIRKTKRKSGEVEEFWVTHTTFAFRSEVPTSASWSFDGSLLAISLGPHVVIYDPQTNTVRRTISTPEGATTIAVRFIGKAGRYLAMVGRQDLTIWDLVTESVEWTWHTEELIQDVIPHPHENSFAIFHGNPALDSSTTTASIFHVKSPSAVNIQTIPYRFQSIAFFAASGPGFNFVGITTSWAVVSFGEQVIHPDTEGTGSTGIPANAEPRARTLFQDIFGVSAFEHLSTEQSGVQPFSTAMLPRSNAPIAVLDHPSHLLPPISTVFDTFMSEFLHTRPRSPVPTLEVDDALETRDMDVDIPETMASKERQTRPVAQEEIDGLVDLFKSHAVDLKHTTTANANGKVNTPTKSLVNGKDRHAPSTGERKPNGSGPKPVIKTPAAAIASPGPAPETQEATPQKSKKRKKSLN